MSIICKKVEVPICERAAYNGTPGFVYATIESKTENRLNLPSDYKYHWAFLPRKYEEWAQRLQNFDIRENDIWITGFPKTGTTWLRNIIWQLKNNLDFNAPLRKTFTEYLEIPIIYEESNGDEQLEMMIKRNDGRVAEYIDLPSPRILKSHLPAFLLPRQIWTTKPRVVYICRNSKDVITSLYYMHRNNFHKYTGTLDNKCERLMSGEISFSPFFDHMKSFWQLRHLDHVLFLTYEELSTDLFAGIKRISKFLGCSYNDEKLKELTEHVSFKSMSAKTEDYFETVMADKRKDPNYK